jgi:hypothetical protein
VEIIQATVIKQNQALRLRARKECFDRDGKERVTGGNDCSTVVDGQAGRREGLQGKQEEPREAREVRCVCMCFVFVLFCF